MTEERFAALALRLGITPETHPQCFERVQAQRAKEMPKVESGGRFYYANLPALTEPRADDVWLAPMLRVIDGVEKDVVFHRLSKEQQACGLGFGGEFGMGKGVTKSEALYRAAVAAGVEVFVEIGAMDA